jgi:hypothetical protein
MPGYCFLRVSRVDKAMSWGVINIDVMYDVGYHESQWRRT